MIMIISSQSVAIFDFVVFLSTPIYLAQEKRKKETCIMWAEPIICDVEPSQNQQHHSWLQ